MTQTMGNMFLVILFKVEVRLLPKWESFLATEMRKFIAMTPEAGGYKACLSSHMGKKEWD